LNPTAQTQTINGITCTNNGDGTYTLNGTASENAFFILMESNDIASFENKKLVGCPVGGMGSTWYTYIDCYNGSTWLKSYNDTGNGILVSGIPSQTNVIRLRIAVKKGVTVNNLIFKPMLTTDLSADYDSFVKYSGSEERLNEQVASLHESSKGIITNLLNPTAQTQTKNGVTFTNNGDGTYTVNGTASADTAIVLMSSNDISILENKKLVGCPVGGGRSIFRLFATCYNGSTWLKEYDDFGNGKIVSNIPSETTVANLDIIVRKGVTVNNLIFKPMLTTDLNATYDDYVRYSGDGSLNENVAALFDKVEEHEATINSLIECTEAEITSLE
jgi:hypothetical protein